MHDEGERLEVENKSEDASEIIWNQIEVVIGKPFWDIEPDEKAIRYVFAKTKAHKKETAKSEIISEEVIIDSGSEISNAPVATKKWWQFWK